VERQFLSFAAGDTAAFLARWFGADAAAGAEAEENAAAASAERAGLEALQDEGEAEQSAGPELPADAVTTYVPLGIRYRSPLSGPVSSGFGWRIHPTEGVLRFHYGIDITAGKGTAIAWFADGTVLYTGESTEYGRYLCVSHDNGVSSFYAHCSRICVKKGQKVESGDKIAEVGDTGNTTGCHLHFEVHKDGKIPSTPRVTAAWHEAEGRAPFPFA
jgi:murein DD-endopeptidase MepM/ murein hydrolase activator NlpD